MVKYRGPTCRIPDNAEWFQIKRKRPRSIAETYSRGETERPKAEQDLDDLLYEKFGIEENPVIEEGEDDAKPRHLKGVGCSYH